jgi:hypothetical protein
MSKKRRLTLIKFDKEGIITQFGYLDHNSHKITTSSIVFNGDSLASATNIFLRGLLERHYPFGDVDTFEVEQIAIDYDFDDIKKLTFSLKFNGEQCGEMSQPFKSLPHQILNKDNSDLIENLSDLALGVWDEFIDSLPKQQSLDLFPLPDLEAYQHMAENAGKPSAFDSPEEYQRKTEEAYQVNVSAR